MTSFVLTIDPNQQRVLIERSEKFAGRRGFKFDIAFYTPQGDDFLIDMRRKDIEIIISNTMFRLDEFDVSFYNNDCIHPTVVSDTVDIASDLRSVMNEIPSVQFAEDK